MDQSLRKTVSIALALVYSVTQVALGSATESNFWGERRKQHATRQTPNVQTQFASLPASLNAPHTPNYNTLLNQLPSVAPTLQKHSTWTSGDASRFARLPEQMRSLIDSIPLNRGSIQEVYDSKSDGGPVIALIQDVHLNAEAQINIASILQELIDQKTINVVGVEGAFRRFDFKPFRTIPDRKITEEVAKDYLNNNLLGAPSYVGITSPVDPPIFAGVDNEEHYNANVNAYLGTRDLKNRVEKKIEEFTKILEGTKQKTFSPELKRFDDLRVSHSKGDLGLGAYVEKLASYGAPDDVLAQFLEAYRMESSLDFNKVDKERRVVIEKLTRTLKDDEISALVSDSLSYRMGRIGFGAYYQHLKSLCDEKGISLRETPVFEKYVRYVLLSDGIKADALLSSIHALEHKVLASLVKSRQEQELADITEQVDFVRKLVAFSLTPSEWESYSQAATTLDDVATRLGQHRNPKEPTPSLAPFETFYREAEVRSHSMVDSLLAESTRGNKALIVGGFHTPDISRILRDRQISYVVVAPTITKVEDVSGTSYLSVFAREKAPLDKLFSGEKLFVKPYFNEIVYRPFAIRLLAGIWARITKSGRVEFDYEGRPVELDVKVNQTANQDAIGPTSSLWAKWILFSAVQYGFKWLQVMRAYRFWAGVIIFGSVLSSPLIRSAQAKDLAGSQTSLARNVPNLETAARRSTLSRRLSVPIQKSGRSPPSLFPDRLEAPVIGIVGGGFYGSLAALVLAQAGYRVKLYEMKGIMAEASKNGQARVHGGFELFFSFLAAQQAKDAAPLLGEAFGDFFYKTFTHVYGVAIDGDVTAEAYKKFIDALGHKADRDYKELDKESVDRIFPKGTVNYAVEVYEDFLDINRLREWIIEQLMFEGVEVIKKRATEEDLKGNDFNVNATYARINQFSDKVIPLKFSVHEQIIVKLPDEYRGVSAQIHGVGLHFEPWHENPEYHMIGLSGKTSHLTDTGFELDLNKLNAANDETKQKLKAGLATGQLVNLGDQSRFETVVASYRKHFNGSPEYIGSLLVQKALPTDVKETPMDQTLWSERWAHLFGGKLARALPAVRDLLIGIDKRLGRASEAPIRIGNAVIPLVQSTGNKEPVLFRATGIIKDLQNFYGRYGNTLSYRRITGPLLEEFGLLAYPLFVVLYAFGVISAKDFQELTGRVSSVKRLGFVGVNTLFLGYRGLSLAIGASLLLVSPFAALIGVVLASTFTGILFIARHEKGQRAPPTLIAVLSSVAIILPFAGLPLIFLVIPLLFHPLVNRVQTSRESALVRDLLDFAADEKKSKTVELLFRAQSDADTGLGRVSDILSSAPAGRLAQRLSSPVFDRDAFMAELRGQLKTRARTDLTSLAVLFERLAILGVPARDLSELRSTLLLDVRRAVIGLEGTPASAEQDKAKLRAILAFLGDRQSGEAPISVEVVLLRSGTVPDELRALSNGGVDVTMRPATSALENGVLYVDRLTGTDVGAMSLEDLAGTLLFLPAGLVDHLDFSSAVGNLTEERRSQILNSLKVALINDALKVRPLDGLLLSNIDKIARAIMIAA